MGLHLRSLLFGLVVAVAGAAPAAVLADSADEELPFLADEAALARALPPRLVWPDRIRSRGSDEHDPSARPVDLPPPSPAFPDVTALLAPLAADVTFAHGAVRIAEGAEQGARAKRLLAVTRAAYARDLHLELDVRRGDETLVALRRATRAGALLFDDDRRESMWPAGIDAGPLLVVPDPIVVRTGARIGIVVELLPDGRMIVELDLHVSTISGERTFDDPAVRRVAPRVEVSHVRAALPMTASGAAHVSFGDLHVDVRVRHDPAPVVRGTRRLVPRSAIASLPPAVRTRPRRLPLTFERELEWEAVPGDLRLPAAWERAARENDVRMVLVPPARVIVEGDEAALVGFSAAVTHIPEVAGRMVRDPRGALSVPVVVGRPFTVLHAELVPVATRTDVEIQSARAAIATRLGYEAAGRAVHGTWAGGALVLTTDLRSARELPGLDPSPRSTEYGGAPTAIGIDQLRLRSESRTERVTGLSAEALSVAPLEDWR